MRALLLLSHSSADGVMNVAKDCRSTVIPGMAYRDCVKAIEWLEQAFGFERHAVYMDPDGKAVMHAELTFCNGMIMLGSVSKESPYAKYRVQPDEIGIGLFAGAHERRHQVGRRKGAPSAASRRR